MKARLDKIEKQLKKNYQRGTIKNEIIKQLKTLD